MILKKLCLENFRVFSYIDVEFSEGINLITGMNGQGKTSILESIYYLALTKSFRTSNDKNVIKYNNNFFNIKSSFIPLPTKSNNIRVFFSNLEGKHIFINDKKIQRFSEYIGTIPCVILTLDDLKLTFGGPAERRKFLNILLSQVSPLYLNNLKNYKRSLLQRNALLMHQNNRTIKSQIEAWNTQLINHGSQLIHKRLELVQFLNDNLSSYYSNFSSSDDCISTLYKSSINKDLNETELENIKDYFFQKLQSVFEYEIEKKISIVGPHRDDIDFYINGKSFKEFGSQGENKTLIIALKFLEWQYLFQRRNINPILLLDDVFGELDDYRRKGLLKFFEETGQTFITTTSEDKFNDLIARKLIIKESEIYDVQ
jgi:DNA replication and repair protein RecF